MSWEEYISDDISDLYEIYDYQHAAAILKNEFPMEFEDICEALSQFRFREEDITSAGGRESNIPKKFSNILRPLGWQEKQLNAKIIVDNSEFSHISHKVDYLKGRVAFDLEWNSKDQTFDRDLITFKSFFEYDKISLAILVTRSNELDQYFKDLGVFQKYGASTTHMKKLLPRMDAGRNGGCPILIFGITTKLLVE